MCKMMLKTSIYCFILMAMSHAQPIQTDQEMDLNPLPPNQVMDDELSGRVENIKLVSTSAVNEIDGETTFKIVMQNEDDAEDNSQMMKNDNEDEDGKINEMLGDMVGNNKCGKSNAANTNEEARLLSGMVQSDQEIDLNPLPPNPVMGDELNSRVENAKLVSTSAVNEVDGEKTFNPDMQTGDAEHENPMTKNDNEREDGDQTDIQQEDDAEDESQMMKNGNEHFDGKIDETEGDRVENNKYDKSNAANTNEEAQLLSESTWRMIAGLLVVIVLMASSIIFFTVLRLL